MIIIAGLILIMLIVWGVRAGIRRARKKALARAEAKKARAAVPAARSSPAEEHGDRPSPAECSPG